MKKITSLTLGVSFLVMVYTGIMLFIVPSGRVAYWSNWELLGLTKTEYGNLHITSMILMVVFGILHVYYNWKPIVSYMKNSAHKISFTKKEFLIAVGLNAVFVVGTLMMVQPFKAFLDFNDDIKTYWEQRYGSPPYGHAEESKLKVLCQRLGIDIEYAKSKLKEKNIKFTPEQTLQEIAKENGMTPNDIYKIIKPKNAEIPERPGQLGQKTLQKLSGMKKIDLQKSMEYLKKKGVNDISPEMRMKEIATQIDMTPGMLYDELTKL